MRFTLAVAAASGKVGHAFFIDDELCYFDLSVKAAESLENAYAHVTKLIAYYNADVLVTEEITANSRKGDRSHALISAIEKAGRDAGITVSPVKREQTYTNKYEEAAALAERFPDLKPILPKPRRTWETEPRETIIFESVVLGGA